MDPRTEHPKDAPAATSMGLGDQSGGANEPGEAEETDVLGTVRTAPRVLRTVVEEAALRVPGVARMAATTTGGGEWSRLLGKGVPRHGVGLTVHANAVDVDLYLVAEPTANMLDVGSAVQEAVGAAIEHILGMRAQQINVYIEDVA
ncbi:MAG TPA: Asp23/Gls24 family envelope stress response protein [Ktedonobacterales bacterium]